MCAGYCNPWPAHRRDAYVMFTIVGYVRLSVCLSDQSVCMSDAPLQCPSSRPLPALGIEMRAHHWRNVCASLATPTPTQRQAHEAIRKANNMCAGYCNPWPAHRRDAHVCLSVCLSDAPIHICIDAAILYLNEYESVLMPPHGLYIFLNLGFNFIAYTCAQVIAIHGRRTAVMLMLCLRLLDMSVCPSVCLICPSVCLMPLCSVILADHYRPSGLKCEIIIGAMCVCLSVCMSVCMFFACFCHPQHVRCNVHVLPCAGKQGTLPRPHFSIHHCITTVCLSCMGLEETRLAVGVYCGAYCCLRRSARAAYQSLHCSSVHQLPCSLPAFKTWWSVFQKHLWVCSLPAELLHVLQQCLWIYPSNCLMTGKTREHGCVVQREYKTRFCSW
jgi:hypothetical protein